MTRLKKLPKWALALLAILLALTAWKVAHQVRLKMTVETDLFSEGQVAMNTGHCGSAIEYFDTFLSRDPHHVPTLQFKLQCEMTLEKWNDAVKTAEKIYQLQVNPENRALLGELYKKVGKQDLAAQVLNQPIATPSVSSTPRK